MRAGLRPRQLSLYLRRAAAKASASNPAEKRERVLRLQPGMKIDKICSRTRTENQLVRVPGCCVLKVNV